MKKVGKYVAGIVLAATFISIPFTSYAATENDLRDVMGIGKLNKKAISEKTDELVDRISRDETYNELVKILKNNDISSNITEKEITEEREAYEKLIKGFNNCESASKVLEDFSSYDSYTYYASQTSYGTLDADYADTTGSEKKLEKLKYLKKIMNNKKNIGKIGSQCQPVTRNGIRVEEINENEVKIYTSKKEKIYAVFSGFILKTNKNSITVQSGESIEITYSGIRSKKKSGEKVKQGDIIGKAKGLSITVSMKMAKKEQNVLFAYGPKGSEWYQDYVSENPWDDSCLDFSKVKDAENSSKKDTSDTKSSTYVITDGNKNRVKIAQPNVQSTQDNVFDEDPFANKQ